MLRNNLMSPEEGGRGPEEGSSSSGAEWYSTSGRPETPTDFNASSTTGSNYAYSSAGQPGGGVHDDDEEDNDDVPLLEELGVRPEQIMQKMKVVLSPTSRVDFHLLDDADLAGPIVVCLLLGMCLFLGGNFTAVGYVYGFSVCGCLALNCVLNLMTAQGISLWITASVLGYSLIPIIGLAALSILLSMKGLLGLILSGGAISWSTHSAIRMLDAKLALAETYWLVVYPVALLYSCFTLISFRVNVTNNFLF